MALLTNKKYIDLLNGQIAHENTNSMIYLSVANYFGANFLVGWQSYFQEWQCEEIKHRDWIIELMVDKGCAPVVGAIQSERLKAFKNIKEVINYVIATEEETTALLNHIMTEADKDAEWDVVSLMDSMIKEQIEEEKKARKLLARLATADWSGIIISLMDKEFND